MSYVATITDIQRQTITVQVEAREAVNTEPPVDLHLYLPLMKGDKLEWVFQKATELGASSFVPLICSRSIAGERISERKLSRWRKIIQEASEQSCRGRIPPLAEPMSFAEGCAHAVEQAAHVFLLWEGTYSDDTPSVPSLRAALHQLMPQQMITGEGGACAMVSGPEGGFTPDELTTAQGHGIMPVSLGPRILRAETAPIAATAAFFYRVEQKQEVS
jgi:16S rRNA (uracil1498-N3)-methyltransferase